VVYLRIGIASKVRTVGVGQIRVHLPVAIIVLLCLNHGD